MGWGVGVGVWLSELEERRHTHRLWKEMNRKKTRELKEEAHRGVNYAQESNQITNSALKRLLW